MAKTKTPNQKKRYLALNKRLNVYMLGVLAIFDKYNQDAANIAISTGYDGSTEFSFADYPYTKQAVDNLVSGYVSDMQALIYRGTSEEWKNSNLVQDLMVDDVLRTYNASKNGDKFQVYYQTNNDQLKAFQQRVDNGMNLSKRLWNQSAIYKSTLEYTIGAAIEVGMSAVVLSKKLSQFLNNYPLLKSTYSEKYGKAINPKQCQYASMRLARSEINMAYRTAEQTRWNQLDFVVGKEIKLSGAHPEHDICDMLAGKYPKDFKWVGWHPNDLCYEIPILNTEDEFWSLDTTGSKNEVKQVPDAMKVWIADNSQRIANAEKRGTLPYWIRDNHWLLDKKEAVLHAADVRHAKRNDALIQAKWDARHARIEEANKPQLTSVQIAAEKRHALRNEQALRQRIQIRQSMSQQEHDYIAFVRSLADKYGIDRSAFEAAVASAQNKTDIIKAADAIKAEIVQKRAAIRHAQRPDGYAEAIIMQRNDNMSTLKYAQAVKRYMSGIVDVDLTAINAALVSGDYLRMLSEAKALKQIGKSIGSLNYIDDPMLVARQFSLSEAQSVNSAVGMKLQQWSSVTDLDQLASKIQFEINYVDTHRKYSTWEISKKAYEKRLAEVNDKIFFRDSANSLAQYSQYTTRSTIYKQLLADCQKAITAGDKTQVTSMLSQLNTQQKQLQAAAAKAAAKKAAQATASASQSATMPANPFEDAAYAQDRINGAVWAKTATEADNALRSAFGKAWNAMTQDERDGLWCYTWTYKCFNEPLQQGYYGGASWKHAIGKKYFDKLTSAIDKCKIEHDIWLQRETSFEELSKWSGFSINHRYSDAEMYALEGKTGTQNSFWSFGSKKGSGLSQGRKIIINAYVPKGTCGAYVEPIAAWGNGVGNFLKNGKPPSWTMSWSAPSRGGYTNAPKWDGISGQKTFSDQQETLLQRGTASKVTKVTKDPKTGIWYIDVEITGQNPTPFIYI